MSHYKEMRETRERTESTGQGGAHITLVVYVIEISNTRMLTVFSLTRFKN